MVKSVVGIDLIYGENAWNEKKSWIYAFGL